MPSQFRIPKATLDGAYGAIMTRVATRRWGQVPDNAYVLWHNRPVLKAVFGFEQKVGRWKALDPHLKAYAEMASAGAIGCSWCLDFGYFLAHTRGLDEAKVREVPRWRESDVFTVAHLCRSPIRAFILYGSFFSFHPGKVKTRSEPDMLNSPHN